jgi:serine/threonine protein kinase
LCQALAHIHSQGVNHLDLRPENIIISDDKSIKLVGFGIRKQIGKKVKGIQTYLAPEITEGNSFNSKADIWSLGVIMYNLMTDRVPFIIKS